MSKVQDIAHISDIHIQLLKRHDEYREVFSNLYKSLKERSPDLIVITGDLFHSRVHLSPEAVNLATEFFTNLCEISDVIVIAGNHDAVLTANNTRMDAISPFVNLFNENRTEDQNKIVYYKGSGVYEYENVDFGVYSVLDYLIPKEKDFREESVKIGMYHGIVSGATLDSGRMTERDQREIDFDYFDRVLLGDVHLPQKVKGNAYYAGSVLQRNFGEQIDKHGYYIHEVENLDEEPEYVKVQNSYGFYKLEFDGVNFKGNFGGEVTKNAKVRVLYPEHLDRKEVEQEFIEKYDYIDNYDLDVITSEEKERNIDIKQDIGELFSLENLNELIEQYYDEDEQETKERMLDLNEEIYEEIKDEIQENFSHGSFKINSVEFDNLFSYGEGNVVDVKNMEGSIGLFSANRMGKSSFLNAIKIALYGDTNLVNRQAKMINTEEDWYRTKISLSKNGDIYDIERTGKKTSSGISNKVSLHKNNESIGGTIREINSKIEELFGTSDAYDKLFYISQRSPEMFLDLTPMQRKEWVYSNLGVDIFEILHRFAKDEYNDKVSKVEDLKDINFEEDIKLKRISIKEIEKSIKKKKEKRSDLKEEKEILQEKIDDIEIIELDDDFWDEYHGLLDDKSDIHDEIKAIDSKIENLNDVIDDIDNHPRLKEIEDAIKDYSEKIHRYEKKIEEGEKSDRCKQLEEKLERVKEQGKNKFNKKKELKNNLPDKPEDDFDESEFLSLKENLNEIEKEISEVEVKKTNHKRRISSAENTASILKEDKRFENEELCQTCPLLEDAFDKKDLIKELNSKIDDLDDKWEELMSRAQEYRDDIGEIEELRDRWKEYDDKKGKLDELSKEVDSLLEKKSDLEEQVEYEENNYKEKLQSKLDEFKKDRKYNEDRLKEKKEEILNSCKSDLKLFKEKRKNQKSELEDTEEKLVEAEEKKQKFEENDDKKELKEKLEHDVEQVDRQLDSIEVHIEEKNRTLGSEQNELKTLKDKKEKFEEYKEDIDLYEEYSRITHKNQLPLLFVKNIIDVFQSEINKVISKMAEFSIELEIDGKDINSYVIEGDKKWDTDLCSGMERFIINIGFRIAISKMGNIVSPNFIMIDEGFNALDSNNIQSIPVIFNYLKKDFDHVFIVSHIQEFRDMVDYNLEIEKVNGKSFISS